MKLGALEAGGTKMVCAIGDENGNIFERASFPTKLPHETMPQMIEFFKTRNIDALGIGSFGPLCLDKNSPEYGNITTTPKLDWRNYPLRDEFASALGVPVGIDTDVNAAALGRVHIVEEQTVQVFIRIVNALDRAGNFILIVIVAGKEYPIRYTGHISAVVGIAFQVLVDIGKIQGIVIFIGECTVAKSGVYMEAFIFIPVLKRLKCKIKQFSGIKN